MPWDQAAIAAADRFFSNGAEPGSASAEPPPPNPASRLSLPGVAAGSALVFTLSVSAYVTPALLGGAGYRVIPTFVAQQILVLLNWPLGSAIAVVLVLVTLAAVTGHQALLGTRLRHLRRGES